MRTIFFDMDGTIADLYNVSNWLEMLIAEDALPYEVAKPLVRLSSLARVLNRLQANGYRLGIISWTSKGGSTRYNNEVADVKRAWLARHLPSVHWDEIHIEPYGTPKQMFSNGEDILFDDEPQNRTNWNGEAFDEKMIMEILRNL